MLFVSALGRVYNPETGKYGNLCEFQCLKDLLWDHYLFKYFVRYFLPIAMAEQTTTEVH